LPAGAIRGEYRLIDAKSLLQELEIGRSMNVNRDLAPKTFHFANEIRLLPLFAMDLTKNTLEVLPRLASVALTGLQIGNESVS
jgi:hypothetical protein